MVNMLLSSKFRCRLLTVMTFAVMALTLIRTGVLLGSRSNNSSLTPSDDSSPLLTVAITYDSSNLYKRYITRNTVLALTTCDSIRVVVYCRECRWLRRAVDRDHRGSGAKVTYASLNRVTSFSRLPVVKMMFQHIQTLEPVSKFYAYCNSDIAFETTSLVKTLKTLKYSMDSHQLFIVGRRINLRMPRVKNTYPLPSPLFTVNPPISTSHQNTFEMHASAPRLQTQKSDNMVSNYWKTSPQPSPQSPALPGTTLQTPSPTSSNMKQPIEPLLHDTTSENFDHRHGFSTPEVLSQLELSFARYRSVDLKSEQGSGGEGGGGGNEPTNTGLFLKSALDYFITDSSYPWSTIPDFVVGRIGYDNWLLQDAVQSGVASTIDVSATVDAVHQTDSFGDLEGKMNSDLSTRFVNLALMNFTDLRKGVTTCCYYETQFDRDFKIFVKKKKGIC